MHRSLVAVLSLLAVGMSASTPTSPARAEPSAASSMVPGGPDALVAGHLAAVLSELVALDTRGMDPHLAARRAHFVDLLRGYVARGEFPENDRYADRLVTIFVDARGVHCAMGYLMAADGRADLVAKVRATKNTGTVWELAADPTLGPEIGAWLATTGLTLFEAARIQPSYCFMNRGGTCLCQRPASPTGVAEGTIRALLYGSGEVEVTVTKVHGTGAAIGDVVRASMTADDVVGRKALVVITAQSETTRGPNPIDGDQVTCVSGQSPDPTYRATVATSLYVQALLSEDCIATLSAVDPVYGMSVCDIGGNPDEGPEVVEQAEVAEGELRASGGCAGGDVGFTAGLVLIGWGLSRRRRAR